MIYGRHQKIRNRPTEIGKGGNQEYKYSDLKATSLLDN